MYEKIVWRIIGPREEILKRKIFLVKFSATYSVLTTSLGLRFSLQMWFEVVKWCLAHATYLLIFKIF